MATRPRPRNVQMSVWGREGQSQCTTLSNGQICCFHILSHFAANDMSIIEGSNVAGQNKEAAPQMVKNGSMDAFHV